MPITGRCFCGSVTFTCDEAPIMTRACWCRDCRYLAAGNATVNAVFKAEGVKVSGQVSEYRSTADSGNAMRRSFCPKCGTPMFSASESRPHLLIIRTGTLDDQELAARQQHLDCFGAELGLHGHIAARSRGSAFVAIISTAPD